MSADLAALAADPTALEQYADPGRFVIEACDRAKTWLRQALEHGDIEAIVETRAQADAVRIYTAQKQHGEDAVLAAKEVVRRAEAGIAAALRRGQAAGLVARQGQQVNRLASTNVLLDEKNTRSVASYFPGGQAQAHAFAMVDGVTGEQFEAAIDQAKAEANLSRANVVRHIQASKTVVDPAPPTTSTTAGPAAGRARRPLPDAFFDAAFDLIKVVDRVVRLAADDRFPRNANQVAAKHRSDLERARDALAGVLERLP